jgi:hypothetical protein
LLRANLAGQKYEKALFNKLLGVNLGQLKSEKAFLNMLLGGNLGTGNSACDDLGT